MGMTPEERAEFESDREIKKERDQCARCEKYVEWNLKYSTPTLTFPIPSPGPAIANPPNSLGPIVRFLSKSVHDLSPPTPTGYPTLHLTPHGSNPTIRCLPCSKYQSGGFSPSHGILICQNRLLSRKHTEDTLSHELIHMHDHLRFNVDWANDIRHHACAEIRASSLSGECRWTRESFGRGVWDFTRQHQECVRRRATLSVSGHPLCNGKEHAESVVNQVFGSCFADTRPFDEIYR